MTWIVQAFLIFFLAAMLHVGIMALTAHLLGIAVVRVSIGMGPAIVERGCFRLGWYLWGGSVKMKDTRGASMSENDPGGAYDLQPRWKQLSILLPGHVVLIGCALAMLGHAGWSAFVSAFSDIPLGAISPLGTGQELLQRGADFARTNTVAAVVALLLVKYSAWNLFPLPAFNGWEILRVLAVGAKPRSGLEERLLPWLLLPVLLLCVGWLMAIGVFAWRAVS